MRSITGIILLAMVLSMTNALSEEKSSVWIVERDMPQTRNLVPILNRTTLVATGPGEPVSCTILRTLEKGQVAKGPFWPAYGSQARMSLPVLVPGDFPCREPRVLEAPGLKQIGEKMRLSWQDIKLKPGEGVAVHSNTLLGPPDMFHREKGLAFGDIRVSTDYKAHISERHTLVLECSLSISNNHEQPAGELEFSFFFPRALLDQETGGPLPLIEDFIYRAQGFDDNHPLDLLISDGLARGAWGPRLTLSRESLKKGEKISCKIIVTGSINQGEKLIVPLISLSARTPARYWSSSEIEITPPAKLNYSDYTHFNLVVADSKLFRISPTRVLVESSSDRVRQYLQSK